jgi:hypothetical protein
MVNPSLLHVIAFEYLSSRKGKFGPSLGIISALRGIPWFLSRRLLKPGLPSEGPNKQSLLLVSAITSQAFIRE